MVVHILKVYKVKYYFHILYAANPLLLGVSCIHVHDCRADDCLQRTFDSRDAAVNSDAASKLGLIWRLASIPSPFPSLSPFFLPSPPSLFFPHFFPLPTIAPPILCTLSLPLEVEPLKSS